MLLGGPHAADFLERAAPIGFTGAKVYSDKVGQAAATKLCRSVMIKGIEALTLECFLAAARAALSAAWAKSSRCWAITPSAVWKYAS